MKKKALTGIRGQDGAYLAKLLLEKCYMKKNLQYYIDLILVLTQKEIKVKYKNSILGYLWSVLNPLSMALVFYFAFKF
ncbi:MAG: hypothetical protein ACPLSP_06550, partial [Fervidicoccus fontis]